MPTKDDIQFQKALLAFRKELENLFHQSLHEMNGWLDREVASRVRDNLLIRSRYDLFRDHTDSIRNNVLIAYREIIKPNCGTISTEAQAALQRIISEGFDKINSNAEAAVRRMARSLGKDESNIEYMLHRLHSFYDLSNSKCKGMLEAEIMKHNLEMSKTANVTEAGEGPDSSKGHKAIQRLKLSPNKREQLNEKIVCEIEDFIDSGSGTLQQAFKTVSSESKKLFGYELSPKAVEGRYSRTQKDKKRRDYSR